MNVSRKFKAYIPPIKRIRKPKEPTGFRWTKEEEHKAITLRARDYTMEEIAKKMGPNFTYNCVRKKIGHMKKEQYSGPCPTCGHHQ